MRKIPLIVLGALLMNQSVFGLDLVKHASLPMADALRIAEAALKECRRQGYDVSVAVVDGGGNLQILLRDENAGPHTVDSSFRKAYTAFSLRKPTRELAALVARNQQIQALREMNEKILILGGGVPIEVNRKVIGGIGVGGAPGAELDEKCAKTGIRAIGLRSD